MCAWVIPWFECGGTFCSVEVVVETGGACDEEWAGNADEVDVGLEVVLKLGFAEADGFFKLEFVGEEWIVATVQAVRRRKASEGISSVESTGHG